jgi:uncharacterized membrane protein YkvA (DUF1232 family)
MILPGALALVTGVILAFFVDGHIGDVSITAIGAVMMVIGAVLLIAGIIRLGFSRRRRVVAGRQGSRPYRTSKGKIIAMVIAVIYIVSPIDIIPDIFLPAGIVDDATAFTWLLYAIGQEMSRRGRLSA